MIQEQTKNLDVESIGGDEIGSIGASINKDDMGFMFELLSSNLYKNPIASICREITSNCFDAHIEANVDDAVVIGFSQDEEGTYVYFKDVGVGMNPARIAKYMEYLNSTKRHTNNQIGFWGLGSKSPLSYTDHFYIITISDGIEYTYMLHKGETEPTLEKLNEQPTTDRNGTTIKIHVQHNDLKKFGESLKKELVYFDNVYYINTDRYCDYYSRLYNDYTIYEGKTFKWNNKSQYSDELHIVLGKVSYPIDWNEINMRSIYLPVGIKFNIGDLQITPSRESIRYDEQTTDVIKKGITRVLAEIKGLFKKQENDATSIFDLMSKGSVKKMLSFYNESSPLRPDGTMIPDGMNIEGIFLPDELDFKHIALKDYPITIPIETPFFFLDTDKKLGDGGLRNCRESTQYLLVKMDRAELCIKIGKQYEKIKNLYIRDSYQAFNRRNVFFVKERKLSYREWKKALKIPNGSIGVTKAIMAYRRVMLSDLKAAGIKDYEDIIIDPEWLVRYRESQKKKKTLVEGNIAVQRLIAERIITWEGGKVEYEGTLKKEDISLQSLYDSTGFTVYGGRADRKKLEELDIILSKRLTRKVDAKVRKNKKGTVYPYQIFQVSQDKIHYLNNRPNMCHIVNINPNIRVIRDVVTAYRIHRMNLQYTPEFATFIKRFNYTIGMKMETIMEFMEDNWRNKASDLELLQELYEMAQDNGIWNTTIISYVQDVEDFFKKVPLLNGVNMSSEITKDEYVVDYLKKSKVKMNEACYTSSLGREPLASDIQIIEIDRPEDEVIQLSNN